MKNENYTLENRERASIKTLSRRFLRCCLHFWEDLKVLSTSNSGEFKSVGARTTSPTTHVPWRWQHGAVESHHHNQKQKQLRLQRGRHQPPISSSCVPLRIWKVVGAGDTGRVPDLWSLKPLSFLGNSGVSSKTHKQSVYSIFLSSHGIYRNL